MLVLRCLVIKTRRCVARLSGVRVQRKIKWHLAHRVAAGDDMRELTSLEAQPAWMSLRGTDMCWVRRLCTAGEMLYR